MLPADLQFERGFVVPRPSCRYEWFSQPTQPQVVGTTTTAHGSLAPNGLCCPIPPRYSDPIRQSRRLPLLSQDHWLYRGSLPATLLWAATETFPDLQQQSFHACHHPYAERRDGCTSPVLPHLQRRSVKETRAARRDIADRHGGRGEIRRQGWSEQKPLDRAQIAGTRLHIVTRS